jgi:hypothetical protein
MRVSNKINTLITTGLIVVLVVTGVACVGKKSSRISGNLSVINSTDKTLSLEGASEAKYQDKVPGIQGAAMLTETYYANSVVFEYNNATKVMKNGKRVGFSALEVNQAVKVEYVSRNGTKIATIIWIK